VVSNSFWNTTTSLQGTSAGGTGLTTAAMQTAANFTGFVFTTTPGATGNNWVMVDADGTLNNAAGAAGATYPMLASEYSTTINNAHQLQLMEMAPAASYTLGSNIDASKTANSTDVWGSSGFVPVGNATTKFTGMFDGLGHTVSNLYINLPTTNFVGLFGYTDTGSVIQNVGLVGGSVSGLGYVGGLVGGNKSTVSSSYATGSVSGDRHGGGLAGQNYGGTVNNSYATGNVNVSGANDAIGGGLVGQSSGTISNSYATGSVSVIAGGSASSGGLVGQSSGTVNNSYATGSVTGSGTSWGAAVGGLEGSNGFGGTISNSYWNSSVNATGIGSQGGTLTGTVSGLTTAAMMQLSSFTSWNTATPNTIANTGGSGAVWRIYEGHTAPLLTSFLTPLTLTGAPDASLTYNGAAQSGAAFTLIANVLGAAATGTNAGFYNGYYSAQQGYDLSGGNLTINPANLSVTGIAASNKTYNGTTAATLTGTAIVAALGGDLVTVGGTGSGTFADRNVGTGKAVTVTGYTLGGASAGNYTIVQPAGVTANITQLASVAWSGGATGNWSSAANWAGGAVPDGANVAAVTIAAGKTVTYDSGVTGTTTLTNSGGLAMAAGTLSLGGNSSISAFSMSGGTLNVTAGTTTLTNAAITAGTLGLSGTGTLNMAGAWSNAGTFNVAAGTVNLGGTFSTAGLGTFTRTGGSVNLTGVLTNTGNTLDVGVAKFGTGGLTSFSGGITGGTVLSTNATPTLTSSSAILDGVIIGGTALTTSGDLWIRHGLTLARHSRENGNPARERIPRSGQNCGVDVGVVPLRGGF
jgi:hypothetical protein